MSELAAKLPAAGVVRVVGLEGAGAGFLVSASGLIVTCAHVLAGCAPGATVRIEPHAGLRPLLATVDLREDPPDVAVLRLTAPVPPEVLVLPLGRSPKTPQPGLRTFGYPEVRREEGLPGELAYYGATERDGYDQLALRSEEATRGYSGAPIWDPELGVVVGMVKGIARGDPGQRLGSTTIGVPVEVIRHLCPELRLPAGCPYRGLDPFTEDHVDDYCGREHATGQLLASLDRSTFVPVVAVSGGGKSSLLQAGLAKGLQDHPVVGLAQRIRCYQRVSGQPHAELLYSLAQHGILLPREAAAAPPQELAGVIRGAVPPAGLIVVVDQFERLYTDCQDAERKRFVALLRCLASDTVKVVIGLRADFYHLALDDLGERLADGQVALAPMTEQDLDRAITAPAERLLRSFQPGLTQRIVADVYGRPGDLPLLEFALTELWERDAASGVLTEETYRGLGVELRDGTHLPGAQGALIHRAEQLWQDLGAAGQPRLRRILIGLVAAPSTETSSASPVAGTRDLSRAARLTQWNEDDQRLIQRLIDARLLTGDRAPTGSQPTVEVSHEVLLRAWPRLRNWLEEHSTFVQWRARDLVPNLERWLDSEENPEFLLPRPLLDPALRWLSKYPDELAGPPTDYIQASKRRRTFRRGLLTGTVAVLVVASLVAAGIFYFLRQSAVSQSHLAQSEEMAAEAMNLLSANVPLAMLLSVQADKRAQTPQARSALLEAAGQPLGDVLAEGGIVDSVAFGRNGQLLAAGDISGHVGLWDTVSGKRIATLPEGRAVNSVAFGRNGQLLAAGDISGRVGLWDTVSGKRIATLPEGSPVYSVAFGRNGQLLAAGDAGGHVGLWDTGSGKRIAILPEGSAVNSVAFGRNGQLLAAGDAGGHVGLWDTGSGKRIAILPEGSAVNSVAFGRNGQLLAAGDAGGHVGLWDTVSGRRTTSLADGSPVNSLAFGRNGQLLAAGDGGGHVGLWDTGSGRRTASLADGGHVNSVAFSPGGHTLAAGDDDGDVGLWDTGSGQRTAALAEGSPVSSLAFGEDGRTLAVGGLGGQVGLWDTGSGTRIATLDEGSVINSVAFSPDEHTLAVGDGSGHVGLWNTVSGKRTATLFEGSPVFSLAFSRDGHTLAVGDWGGHVVLWNTVSRKWTAILPEVSHVFSLAFSRDGTLAAGDYGGRADLWNTVSHKRTVSYKRTASLFEGSPVSSVAFSSDGDTLAVGDYRGNVGLWNTGSHKRTVTLAEGSPVSSVAFSQDGHTLAVGDAGGDAGLWNTGSGKRTATLGEGGPIDGVAFSQDGHTLAIGDLNGNVALLRQSLWNLTDELLSHLICGEVRENMTLAQWTANAPGQPYQKTCSRYP